MPVGHANRTDVVALGEEQLEDHAAVLVEPLGFGADFHALEDGCHAGGQQLVASLDLDQTKAACAHVGQALHMAEGGNVDVVLQRHLENGLAGKSADFLFVDD
jgi:hypothetical protein